MKVKFLRDEIYETEGPGKGPKFDAGKVYDLPEDKANRWINRGAAAAVDAKHNGEVEQPGHAEGKANKSAPTTRGAK